MPDQLVGVACVQGEDRVPDAGPDGQWLAADHERRGEGLVEAFPERQRGLPRLRSADQHSELVATQACHQVARPGALTQPPADRDQKLVSCLVTEPIVDRLEAVEIQEEQGELLIVLLGAGDGDAECLAELRAVGQAR